MPDNKWNNPELHECIERIVGRYWSEAFILLDKVLSNDPNDPEYSANTVYHCLENVVTFQNLYYGEKIPNVADYLRNNGYSEEDITLLDQQRADEKCRCPWIED